MTGPPEHAAVLHSVPPWLAQLWWQELGAERARTLLGAINDPPESALRVNTVRAAREQVIEQLPVAAHPVAALPEALVLEEPFDVQGSELFAGGAIMAQSRGSMLAGLALAPAAGAAVLDLCAAPGAKATQLGALTGPEGRLTAVERHPGRAAALERTFQRMGIGWAQVRVADAAQPSDGDREAYDAVLVDPPCSGLGTLQSRPDLRWRTGPERIADLTGLQLAILRAGAQATRPGGTLVYSVCTISRSEGDRGRSGAAGRAARVRGAGPGRVVAGGRRWPISADDARPRRYRRLLHCAAARAGDARPPVSLRGVSDPAHGEKLGPECPSCGEPWLRPTAVPGRYRCVYCLQRFELVSVCPNCGEHSTIVRMSSTAIVACNHCHASMLQAV